MANFTDLFVDRARDERRALAAQSAIQQQGAQQIFNQVQGSPELPGPVRGGGLGGIPAVPGLTSLPAGDQGAAFASIVAQTPGFETSGISMFALAIQNRAQRVQNQAQFETTDTRLTSQATNKLEQDHTQWLAEQALRVGKRSEEAQFHIMKMMLNAQEIVIGKTSARHAARTAEIAEARFSRLTNPFMKDHKKSGMM